MTKKPLKKAATVVANFLTIELETSLIEDVAPLKRKASTGQQKKKASERAAKPLASRKAKVNSKGADEDLVEVELMID